MRIKVMIIVNSAWNLYNFRSDQIRSLISSGYEVLTVGPRDEYTPKLSSLGCRCIYIPMDNKGINPVNDFLLFLRIYSLMKAEKPNVYLGYTIKPNIYGSLAATLLKIPYINNVTGLGTAFIKGGWLNILVKYLYRIAFSRSSKVFFQNKDDCYLFNSEGIVSIEASDILPGSGINLNRFSPVSLPSKTQIRFLLISRMIWDKGVAEFVDAARLLKKRGLKADFCLLGFLDVQNRTAISRSQLDQWIAEGVIQYLGVSEDVREEIALADCVVLPSYREGTPRTLLEAAAMARPIVTTDVVGCRDVVKDKLNGFLCRVKNSIDLAEKMSCIATMSPVDREAMGLLGRKRVEELYSEKIVINKYSTAIRYCLKNFT